MCSSADVIPSRAFTRGDSYLVVHVLERKDDARRVEPARGSSVAAVVASYTSINARKGLVGLTRKGRVSDTYLAWSLENVLNLRRSLNSSPPTLGSSRKYRQSLSLRVRFLFVTLMHFHTPYILPPDVCACIIYLSALYDYVQT